MLKRELQESRKQKKFERLKEGDITEEIADEIVKLVLKSKPSTEANAVEKKNLDDIAKLKQRIFSLENRVEKYIKNFKIVATEAERHLTERAEEISKENEQTIVNLQAQIEDLRTAMIRLSNEVKKIKTE